MTRQLSHVVGCVGVAQLVDRGNRKHNHWHRVEYRQPLREASRDFSVAEPVIDEIDDRLNRKSAVIACHSHNDNPLLVHDVTHFALSRTLDSAS